MNNKFSIIFEGDLEETYILNFNVHATDIGNRWFNEIKKHHIPYENDRLYGFDETCWNEEKLVMELNKCIDQINEREEVIVHRAYVGMPQDQLNHLHHYFENLRGGILCPGDFYCHATKDEQWWLERFNIIIHRTEDFYNSRKISKLLPRVVVSIRDRDRFELNQGDYDLFTLKNKFGQVSINYCEVGKPLWDVFKDNDDIVGEDNIRPLKYYSADFNITFHNNSPGKNKMQEFRDWFIRNENYLGNIGISRDSMLSLGDIPVAELDRGQGSEEEILDKMQNMRMVKEIVIL